MYKFITFALCFFIASSALLKRFYLSGVNYDAPLIINLMYHNLFALDFPPWEVGLAGSYFKTHTPFIMNIISWLSYLQPFNLLEYTSIVFGLFCGFFGYISYLMLSKSFSFGRIAGVFLAFCMVFNYYNTRCLYEVHFELFYIVLLCGFLYYFSQQQYTKSYIVLFLFLISREDFGFHLFTLIITMLIFKVELKTQDRIRLIKIAAISFLSSVLLCYFKSFFPGDHAFSRIYFDSSFATLLKILHPAHIFDGLKTLVKSNLYSILNLTILLLFSIGYRTFYTIIPVLSLMPWVGLHVVATNKLTNELPWYYDFPLAIMFVWPALAVLMFKPEPQLQRKLKYLQITLLVIGLGYSVPFFKKIFPLPTIDNIRNMHIFTQQVAGRPTDDIVVTRDVATLNPKIYHGQDIYPTTKKGAIQYIYFVQNYNSYQDTLSYPYRYKIENTPIRILSTKPISSEEYRNFIVNDNFWIEALSYSKEHMYKPSVTPLTIEYYKSKKLKKKRIYFAAGKYCGVVDISHGDGYELNVFNAEDQSVYTSSEQRFCFNLVNAGDYYLTILPKNKSQQLLLNKLEIVRHD